MKLRGKTKMWWAILITAVLTSLLTLVVLNLRAGEKHIRYQLTHRFSVEDPQFLRCMGQLLSPGILPGNRITALHNGDQIFPAMLEAIRGAQMQAAFTDNWIKARAQVLFSSNYFPELNPAGDSWRRCSKARWVEAVKVSG